MLTKETKAALKEWVKLVNASLMAVDTADVINVDVQIAGNALLLELDREPEAVFTPQPPAAPPSRVV